MARENLSKEQSGTTNPYTNRLKVEKPIELKVYQAASGGTVSAPDDEAPVAVLVCHGMGQQVPFETLNQAVAALQRIAQSTRDEKKYKITSTHARYVTLGDRYLPRIEMTLQHEEANGKKREVHIYESYWAPLTEGKATIADTASFMWDAGLSGLQRSFAPKPFSRWMFGSMKDVVLNESVKVTQRKLRLWKAGLGVAALTGILAAIASMIGNPSLSQLANGLFFVAVILCVLLTIGLVFQIRKTARYLLYALLVFGSLCVMNATIAAVTAARATSQAFTGGSAPWPSDSLLSLLTFDFALALLWCLVFFGIGIGVPMARRGQRKRRRDNASGSLAILPAERWLYRHLVWIGLIGLVVMGLLVIPYHLIGNGSGKTLPDAAYRDSANVVTFHGQGTRQLWMIVPVWLLVIGLSNKVREWFIEYMGDVAIYVSSHKLNKFHETRQKIQEVTRTAACSIYGALKAGDNKFLYKEVTVVGHSLGSVVAYDCLNAAINQDLLLSNKIDVCGRTRLLLTFGSPLDKTAFIFRTQMPEMSEAREALASAVQPMIVTTDTRPKTWINVWSFDDWISGDLTFYDDPDWTEQESYRVRNKEDEEAYTPAACHSDYWDNELVPTILYTAITPPDTLPKEYPLT